uniref:Transposase n=1 Tax=Ditylenchus dipsaci TaxID=166011 RepID=A0A915DEK5_9BILA
MKRDDARAERIAQDWFAKFKMGISTEIDKDQLRRLLKEDGRQTCGQLAEKMNYGHLTVSGHLQTMGFTQKLGAWVPVTYWEIKCVKRSGNL